MPPGGRIQEYKRKNKKRLDPKDYTIAKLDHATVWKSPGQVLGEPFILDSLDGCDIYIVDHCGQVTMDDCRNTRIVVGPTKGSFFLRNCHNSHITVACRQFRCVDCTNCTIRLYCHTESPVIESSSNMTFMPWNVSYPSLAAQFDSANLNPQINYWNSIFDFTAEDSSVPSPHYTVASAYSTAVRRLTLPGSDAEPADADNPVPIPAPAHNADPEWTSVPAAAKADPGVSSSTGAVLLADPSPAASPTGGAQEEDDEPGAVIFGSMLDHSEDRSEDDPEAGPDSVTLVMVPSASPSASPAPSPTAQAQPRAEAGVEVEEGPVEDVEDRPVRFSMCVPDASLSDEEQEQEQEADAVAEPLPAPSPADSTDDIEALALAALAAPAPRERVRRDSALPGFTPAPVPAAALAVAEEEEEEEETKADAEANASPAAASGPAAGSPATEELQVEEWVEWDDWDALPMRTRADTVDDAPTDPRAQLIREKNASLPSDGPRLRPRLMHVRTLRPSRKEQEQSEGKEREREGEAKRDEARRLEAEERRRKLLDMTLIASVTCIDDLERLERLSLPEDAPPRLEISSSTDSPSSPEGDGPATPSPAANNTNTGNDADADVAVATDTADAAAPATPVAGAAADADTGADDAQLRLLLGVNSPRAEGAPDWAALTAAREGELGKPAEDAPMTHDEAWGRVREAVLTMKDPPAIVTLDKRSLPLCSCLGGPVRFSDADAEAQRAVLLAAATAYDPAEPAHWALLRGVHANVLGDAAVARMGEHWTALGFQGADPASDLRGSGVFGLVQLHFLTERYPALVKKLYALSVDDRQCFPLATTALNMTVLLLQWLRTPAAVRYRRGAGRTARSLVALLQLVYAACLHHFLLLWKRHNYTVRDFTAAKSAVHAALRKDPHALVRGFEQAHKETY